MTHRFVENLDCGEMAEGTSLCSILRESRMKRIAQRWSALAAIALLAAACGEPPAGVEPGGDDGGDSGQSTLLLTRVGQGIVEAHPGDTIPLMALLVRSEVGGVPDQSVHFRIAEDPGGTTLESETVTTDETGIAQTQLRIGPNTGVITLRATSGTAESKAVWKIEVRNVVKRLRIVPDSITLLDGVASAQVSASPRMQVNLKAKVSVETMNGERALGGETVTFSLVQGVTGTTFPGDYRPTTTANGEVTVSLMVGDTIGTVIAKATIEGNLSATWEIDISDSGTGGACENSMQCPVGFFCKAGICTGTGGGGGCNTSERPCPLGYFCSSSGMCEPATGGGCESCPDDFHCSEDLSACVPDNPDCSDEIPCPSGFDCVNGMCTPDDGSNIDVSGFWYTKHKFDVRKAMPGWVRGLADATRLIDQILLGQIPNMPSIVNSIVRAIVKQYVPDWVVTIVGIMDAAFTIFSDLESEGEMLLNTVDSTGQFLSGEEYWTSFVFYFLPLCDGNIQSGWGQQPPCARMDVYTTELEQADLAVDVKPFTARVVADTSSGGFKVMIDPRTVNMNFGGILLYVLNYAVQVSTGYESFEEALPEMVDCEGLAYSIGILEDLVEIACVVAVDAATKAIVRQLSGATVTQRDALNFSGSAAARPKPGNSRVAGELGYADYLTRNPADGNWNGKFKIVLSVDDVPGRWRASRDPFPYQY